MLAVVKLLLGVLLLFLLQPITNSQCSQELIGDGTCHVDCLVEEFNFDKGDCCTEELLTNNICNVECLAAESNFDNGDCCEKENSTDVQCRKFQIGDGKCQDLCNTPECGFDGGDCLESNELETCITNVQQKRNGNFQQTPNNEAIEARCNRTFSLCTLQSLGQCQVNLINDGFCDFRCDEDACVGESRDCELSFAWQVGRPVMIVMGVLVILSFTLAVALWGFGSSSEVYVLADDGRSALTRSQYDSGNSSEALLSFASNRNFARSNTAQTGWGSFRNFARRQFSPSNPGTAGSSHVSDASNSNLGRKNTDGRTMSLGEDANASN